MPLTQLFNYVLY